jgi:hypothetical protein
MPHPQPTTTRRRPRDEGHSSCTATGADRSLPEQFIARHHPAGSAANDKVGFFATLEEAQAGLDALFDGNSWQGIRNEPTGARWVRADGGSWVIKTPADRPLGRRVCLDPGWTPCADRQLPTSPSTPGRPHLARTDSQPWSSIEAAVHSSGTGTRGRR